MTNFYLYFKNGFGFATAWEMAFGHPWYVSALEFLWHLVLLVGFILGIYLILDVIDHHTGQAVAAQAEYVQELEKVVAKCLSDSVGRPVVIDHEIYLCGIVPTGERV